MSTEAARGGGGADRPGLRDLQPGGRTHFVPSQRQPSPAWAAAAAGREVQVLEGGAGFPLLQPRRGGASRYISGTESEFTREDTTSPCYQNVGNIR